MKYILILLFGISSNLAVGQDAQVDTVALNLLNKMSAILGEMNSLRFELATANDEQNDLFENERRFARHEVILSNANKMTIHSESDKGSRGIWYNGEYFNYYSFDENNYVTLSAPGTTMGMIDSMNTHFGIDFPAADLFYPTLTEDLLAHFESIRYLGRRLVEGQDCFYIMASSETMTFQLWISNSALFLPKRYLIIDKEKAYQQHQGTFKEWDLNLELPNSTFEFVPPASAKMISILSKS